MFDKNNWFCKPKTKEEAFEIFNIALKLGASVLEIPRGYYIVENEDYCFFSWSEYEYWGVGSGETSTTDYPQSFKIELEELRELTRTTKLVKCKFEYCDDEVVCTIKTFDDETNTYWFRTEDGKNHIVEADKVIITNFTEKELWCNTVMSHIGDTQNIPDILEIIYDKMIDKKTV